jgi:hypothetical protein
MINFPLINWIILRFKILLTFHLEIKHLKFDKLRKVEKP